MVDSRGHLPAGPWSFDAEVADCFDDMLRRSIPEHAEMRRLCAELVRHWAPRGLVVDVGCANGEALASCIAGRSPVQALGLDVSEPMLTAARERFLAEPGIRLRHHDLRRGLGSVVSDSSAAAVLCVLTLQFTPIEYRQEIVLSFARALRPGGLLVLVEKVLGSTAETNRAMVQLYYAMKREHGYSLEEIDRKRLSLEGVLVPVTARWNEELLAQAGLVDVDCFWRWMNFAGWVARRAP